MEILIKRLNDDAILPAYNSEAGPGIDLCIHGDITVEPGARIVVPTGIAMAVPVGYIGLIWNQESIVLDEPIKVTTSMIDSGYREEIKVELVNTGAESRTFTSGERIAQVLIQQIHRAHLIEAEDLSASHRI